MSTLISRIIRDNTIHDEWNVSIDFLLHDKFKSRSKFIVRKHGLVIIILFNFLFLFQMVSTSIGITLPSQMPILISSKTTEAQTVSLQLTDSAKSELYQFTHNAPNETNITLDSKNDSDIQQSELYAEYLINPYHSKELSMKEATLYEPVINTDQTVPDPESLEPIPNPLLTAIDKQKSISMNSSPMHTKPIAQFGSTDNLAPKKEESSSIFNFSNYFGSISGVIPPGSEILYGDNLLPTQEG